ncbi:MAG: hypothetical protein C0463_07025 [Idiomarina sp.]|nr:hypothetical protein [Idiomarina sp.]
MDKVKRGRVGLVWANGRLAGTLREITDGLRFEYQFQYDRDYLKDGCPIGHHFPLNQAPFISDVLPPFFENLTSEGWVRRYQSAKARIDKQDSFGLLLANGRDLIGAISVTPQTKEA